ncbi:PAS domain S-box protein [Verrucomicrobia bacterium]|nr:PAS domain S-box protein [Verrucomicrobiota bacterium]
MGEKPSYEELEKRLAQFEAKDEAFAELERDLRGNAEKYRAIFEQSIVAIVVVDLYGNLIEFNRNVYEILGYTREEYMEKNISGIDADKSLEEIVAHHKRILEKGADTFETRLRTKSGKLLNVLINSTPIRINDQTYFQNITIDITDRITARRLLKESHDKLEKRVEERTAELQMKSDSLEEVNTALKVLLKKREEDKTELEGNVLTNVRNLILPSLGKLKETRLDTAQASYLSVLEANIDDIASPFYHRLSTHLLNFTPTEIEVSNMIKQGMTTKAIASYLNVSTRTIDFHRRNIRKKIGLDNEKVNLRTYLMSMV